MEDQARFEEVVALRLVGHDASLATRAGLPDRPLGRFTLHGGDRVESLSPAFASFAPRVLGFVHGPLGKCLGLRLESRIVDARSDLRRPR